MKYNKITSTEKGVDIVINLPFMDESVENTKYINLVDKYRSFLAESVKIRIEKCQNDLNNSLNKIVKTTESYIVYEHYITNEVHIFNIESFNSMIDILYYLEEVPIAKVYDFSIIQLGQLIKAIGANSNSSVNNTKAEQLMSLFMIEFAEKFKMV